ncbi:MAG: BACON domain-containing carbohydrate-binding protein, partial [Bryobacteraceae bacterium]
YGGAGQVGRQMNVTVNGTTQQAGPSPADFTSPFTLGTSYLLFNTTSDTNGTIAISMSTITSAVPAGGWAEADLNGLQLVGALNTPPSCVTTLSPQGGVSFPASGGTANIAVTASSCNWNSSNNGVSWMHVTSGTSGNGNGTVTIQADANTGTVRSGSITIAGNPFAVQQDTGVTVELLPVGSMAQIASGGGWDTSLTLVNTSAAPVEVELGFSGNDGSALALPFTFPQQTGGAPIFGATLDQLMNPNATLVIDTNSGSGSVGWAELFSSHIGGFAIFTYTPSGQAAVVPLETRNASSYLLAFDDTGTVATGLAIANVAASAASVGVILRNDTGAQIGTGTISLPAQGHNSFMLTGAPAGFPSVPASIRGTVEFDTPSGGQISVLGLRANGAAVTTLPVLANVGTGGGTLAHIASGGGWQTTLTLVNTGAEAATVNLHFYGDNGAAVSLPLSFPQNSTTATESSLSQSIAAGASLIVVLQDGAASATTGSAVLTTAGNVGGFAVFRYNPSGQEAVVPLETVNASSYVLAFDNTGTVATGLAIANVAAQAADVNVVIRNDTGAQIGTGTISLPAQGHTSFMLAGPPQGFPSVPAGIRGTIEFDTPAGGQIAPLGLRAKGVTITTIPVMENSGSGGGGKMFAPYIDMSDTLAQSLSAVASASGIKWFTMGFVVGSGCTPQWEGLNVPLSADNMQNSQTIQSDVQALQAAGGKVIVSNGGAVGTELADSCANVASTQAGYQAEITRYGTLYIDFDIENGVTAPGIGVRSQAIAGLATANPGLVVSLTLPVMPTGLTATGVSILNSAHANNAPIATVNVMAMDYGSSSDNGGHMGADAEAAAAAARTQVQAAGLTAGIGITPMIGVNDTTTEVFQLADASALVSWANLNSNSYINRLSYWSVGRDNGSCAGNGTAQSSCSSISQNPYQFAGIFEGF